MKISITRQHIKHGKRDRATLCPIALACKEKGFKRIKIHYDEFEIDGHIGYLPQKACQFITAFDKGLPVEPFTFRLRFSK